MLVFKQQLTRILILISLSFIISGCNQKRNKLPANKTTSSQFFFIQNNRFTNNQITKIIELSTIRQKGYVIIIPVPMTDNNHLANELKNRFYFQEIMSVHILNINPKYRLKKSDIIMLENATIICIAGQNTKGFSTWAKKEEIKKFLNHAMNNGAILAAHESYKSWLKN